MITILSSQYDVRQFTIVILQMVLEYWIIQRRLTDSTVAYINH